MTETELAYLAGILDGEGSLSLARRGAADRGYVTPSVQVTNTSKVLIDWLSSSFGGHVYQHARRENRKDCWLWCCFGAVARELVRDARPYLRVKAPQADLILRMATTAGNNRLSDGERHARIAALDEMRALNRRGAPKESLF